MRKKLLLFFCIVSIAAKFPAPEGYVTDEAGVISAKASSVIENLSSRIEKDAGIQLAVVTVKTLDGLSIEDYSWQLFEKWGIGKAATDEGILLLVAPGERQVRIETGYGAEAFLPDGLAGEIIRTKIIPYFRQQDFSSGILNGAVSILAIAAKEKNIKLSLPEEALPAPAENKASPLAVIINIIILLLIFRGRLFFLPFLLGGGYYSGGRGGFGGFSGFGGGLSGGGGASGRW